MNTQTYQPRRSGKSTGRAHWFWSAAVTAGLFLLLPFTTILQVGNEGRSLPDVPIPKDDPPRLDPLDDPQDPVEPDEDVPELVELREPITLTDLQFAGLPPGMGGFGPGGLEFLKGLNPSMEELIFKEEQLDRKPRVIRQGRLDYPFELQRNRVEGYVLLKVIIDERGRVRVAAVLESSHQEFVRAAIQSTENSLFEPPTRHGEAVKAYYLLPIRFSLR